ncbi:MAG: sulfotransferase [Planctomycetota bacterium]
MFFRRKRSKVFVIGRNKTGTTSLGRALQELGFRLGKQSVAEGLLEDWGRRDFREVIRYCRTADAFQDTPFSLDYTYQVLDHAYPGSRFVLSVRDSADDWFDSLTRFQSQMIGKGRLPTAADLQACEYRYQGWLWRTHQLIYGATEATLYDRDLYCTHYENYNRGVRHYFRERPQDLLVLNLANDSAMLDLANFVDRTPQGLSMPHLNASTRTDQ